MPAFEFAHRFACVVLLGTAVYAFDISRFREHFMFVKEADGARHVRKRMHDLLEAASIPVLNAHLRYAVLTLVGSGAI